METFTRSCIIPLAIFIRKVKIINKLESDILSDRRRISRFIRHWLLGGKITLRLTLDHDVLLIETRRSHVEIVKKKRRERERERVEKIKERKNTHSGCIERESVRT